MRYKESAGAKWEIIADLRCDNNFRKIRNNFREIRIPGITANTKWPVIEIELGGNWTGSSLDYADLLYLCRNRQNKCMIIHEYTSLESICGQKKFGHGQGHLCILNNALIKNSTSSVCSMISKILRISRLWSFYVCQYVRKFYCPIDASKICRLKSYSSAK